MISMIAATSLNGVIGLGNSNSIPWQGKYPEDMKFFREKTKDSIVIMGRKTFESIGKPLSERKNFVISSNTEKFKDFTPDVLEACTSLTEAISKANLKNKKIYIIGGASLYEEGLKIVTSIFLTIIPEVVEGENLIKFPWINPLVFKPTLNKVGELDLLEYYK